jgi:autotransporter-associated beta strand protein
MHVLPQNLLTIPKRLALAHVAAVTCACVVLFGAQAEAAILSSKRGFADVGASYSNLQATGAGWYYTWGTGAANPGGFNAKHYPMFWSAPGQTTINNTLAAEPDYILGFNEPERPDQANMSVSAAISAWTTISNSTIAYNDANGTNIKLVSPAVADTGGADGGQQWLASFMSQANANGLKVDAVAFHWYGVSNPNNPSGAASLFLSRVDSYHNSYGKPVFITEFAIHDWGGAYTDAAIVEANRQFLNIVIPGLESRSHVAGYSWYHWFSDARLYDSNFVPTVMAYDYVGAVQNGSTSNAGGANLGEHVAYLNGGTLTMTGSAGTVKYLHALYDPNVSTNTSVISGSIDWAPTNWTKIQSGATLRKSGTNTVSLTSGTIANNGVLEVAEGVLRLGIVPSGSGSLRIYSTGGATGSTGRLELTGNVNVTQPVTFLPRNDPGQSDGIRNISGINTLGGGLTIDVGGSQTRIQSDAGQLTISGPLTTTASSARNLYLQGSGNGVISGVISDNSANANGKINIAKEGVGIWTLSAASTYTGTTVINGGTLRAGNASGSATGSGAVTVNNGGTLGGTGFITTANSDVTISAGGSLAPGVAAGTLTFDLGAGELDLSAVTTGGLNFQLGPPSLPNASDRIVLNSGTLNIGTLDFSDFTFFNLFGAGVGTYLLIDAQSSIVGSLGSASGMYAGFPATIRLDTTNYDVLLDVGLPGDFNGDGRVDAADFVVWRKTDGTIPQYSLWRSYFGQSVGSGALQAGAVPETSAIACWCSVLIGWAVAARPKRLGA